MRGRRSAPDRRRSGPHGEDRWWDPADQAVAESRLLRASDLGRGWSGAAMVNNVERLDPFGDDEASDAVRAVVAGRRRTALHEGDAWRRRRDTALAVLRVEVFDQPDDGAHRQVWDDHGVASLDATWRQRWRERDRTPGWIEARRRSTDASMPTPPAMVWLVVEDQTGVGDRGLVTFYEHVTMWVDRAVVTLTIRHDQGTDADEAVVSALDAIGGRLRAALER